MLDGDKVPGLSPTYWNLYQQVRENHWSDEELAYEALSPLVKDIKRYGDGPIKLAEQIGVQFKQILAEPLFVDWDEESQKIEMVAQQTYGNVRAISLMVDASKQLLQDLRYGEQIQDIPVELVARYFRQVYLSRFEESLPFEPYQYEESQLVTAKLEGMRAYIVYWINEIAERVLNKEGVAKIRLPRRNQQKQTTEELLDIDLL